MEYPMKITFILEEKDNALTNVFVVEDDIQWNKLIIKFADFLNAQYGYDVKEKIAFISDYNFHDNWSVVGERTISRDAFAIAKNFDEEREDTQEEMEFDE
jgi:hypothetical protein